MKTSANSQIRSRGKGELSHPQIRALHPLKRNLKRVMSAYNAETDENGRKLVVSLNSSPAVATAELGAFCPYPFCCAMLLGPIRGETSGSKKRVCLAEDSTWAFAVGLVSRALECSLRKNR